jgi:hypothetical protein
MKKIILSFLLLIAFSSSSFSAEKDYKMCSIAGYFDGAKKEFMFGIAMRIVMEKKLMNKEGTNGTDSICETLYQKAQDTGVADLKRGKYNFKFVDEVKLASEVNIFSNKVYDSIISNINWEK